MSENSSFSVALLRSGFFGFIGTKPRQTRFSLTGRRELCSFGVLKLSMFCRVWGDRVIDNAVES